MVIDSFSRRLYVRALKSKADNTNAFSEILTDIQQYAGSLPYLIVSDRGSEFTNQKFQSLLKSKNIAHLAVHSETKASQAERVIRTLKQRISRYQLYRNSFRYVDVLQKLVDSYNKSKHRMIGVAPNDVNIQTEEMVYKTLYGPVKKKKPQQRGKQFKKNDTVVITSRIRTFRKDYEQKWSFEHFTINKTNRGNIASDPPTYELKDLHDEVISGKFYTGELQKITPANSYRIEKIVKRFPARKEVEVKWLGWPESFNSIVPTKSLQNI